MLKETETESGIFVCPYCGNDELWYSKWQNRIIDGEKKWIFLGSYKKPIMLAPDYKTYYSSWMTALATPWYLPQFYQEPEKCWEKTGGSTEKEWNEFLQKFGCWKCQFSSGNFNDFIINKQINQNKD